MNGAPRHGPVESLVRFDEQRWQHIDDEWLPDDLLGDLYARARSDRDLLVQVMQERRDLIGLLEKVAPSKLRALQSGTPPEELGDGDEERIIVTIDRSAPGKVGPRVLTPPRLQASLIAAVDRAERRANKEEIPVPLAWPILADHFGGGLWPGVHYLNKATGVGGTQFALRQALYAASLAFPTLYIGLEMGELDIELRALGLKSGVPWSKLWTGNATPEEIARVRREAPALAELAFHYEIARPMGYSVKQIAESIEALRAAYPDRSRPMFVVLDFLQLVGDEPFDEHELRIRIGRASYALRDLASRLDVSVLCISSIAREKVKLLGQIRDAAGLVCDEIDGRPMNRCILDPDAIVGTGKESGEIEFSGDSVSIIARVPGTWDGRGFDVIVATAKGRATGAMWSPLRFTGFDWTECVDGGARILAAWQATDDKREQKREEKAAKKDQKRFDRLLSDCIAVLRYVQAEGAQAIARGAKLQVGDNSGRWSAVQAKLGLGLRGRHNAGPGEKPKHLTVDRARLPVDVLEQLRATSNGAGAAATSVECES